MKKENFPKRYQDHITEIENYKIRLLPCCVQGNEYIVHIDDGQSITGTNSREVIKEVKDYINSLYFSDREATQGERTGYDDEER